MNVICVETSENIKIAFLCMDGAHTPALCDTVLTFFDAVMRESRGRTAGKGGSHQHHLAAVGTEVSTGVGTHERSGMQTFLGLVRPASHGNT